jgi:hypothetical protein
VAAGGEKIKIKDKGHLLILREMSQREINLVLEAINDLRQSNTESHEAIRETIKAGIHGLQLKIETDNEILNKTIGALTGEIKEHNGRLRKVEQIQDTHDGKIIIFDKHVMFLATLKKRWLLATIGILVFFACINFLLNTGWMQKIILFLIDKL